MTELFFKGKEFVYNHHLAVPHRPLVADAARSVEAPDLSGNLIIQGDNLHALKSLLPHYAGRVDCIFIDPPYNTGNEGWRYNDKVNAPMIKAWLDENPVGVDDGLRHDKWCAMMWPRLKLLHELLAEDGFIYICIDDNEFHHIRLLMNEIWGNDCYVSSIVKQSKIGGGSDSIHIVKEHEYGLLFAKDISLLEPMFIDFDETYLKRYKEEDEKGKYFWDTFSRSGLKSPIRYEVVAPDGQKILGDWIRSEKRFHEDLEKGEITFKKLDSGKWSVQFKQYLNEKGKKPRSLEVGKGGTIDGKKELKAIFDDDRIFPYPKSCQYIQNIISLIPKENALILDSFAGSGTTAHAVLKANAEDGGNRKFIMVEMEEDIADSVTAERIRRIINGYSHGDKTTDGLGGTFTFCTLGDAIDLNRILSGETLPEYKTLAPVLFHMATNETLDVASIKSNKHYVGATEHEVVWMIYQSNLDWLKSDAAALTLSKAKEIAATDPDKAHLVFAPARFVSEKVLKEENLSVKFVPFPDALYQIERESE